VTSDGRGIGRGVVLYTLACVLAIGLAGAVFATVYRTPSERQAVLVSAVIALVVQLIAFTFARLLAERGNAIAGWGVGALVCFVALIVFGFVSRALGVPQNAALLSLATFFFLTELIEPPLLTV
jgi:heme/copper-type cytochrome/quinol oxidase subunit 4